MPDFSVALAGQPSVANILGIGDSIMFGAQANAVSAVDLLDVSPGITVSKLAVSGEQMATEVTKAKSGAYSLSLSASRLNIAIVQSGTNDLNIASLTDAQLYVIATNMVALLQSLGFYVVLATVLPRTDTVNGWNSTKEGYRTAYNTRVTANAAGADAIADVAADPNMGDASGAPSNTRLFTGGLHPTSRGQALLVPTYRAAVAQALAVATTIKNQGLASAAPTYAAAKFGQGLTGDVGILGARLPLTGPLTVELWASTTATTGAYVAAGQGTTGIGASFYMGASAGKFLANVTASNFTTGSTTSITAGATINDGQYHHLAMVDDGNGTSTSTAFYVDGVAQGTMQGITRTNTLNFTIRKNDQKTSSFTWDGGVDEVAIWNIAKYTAAFTPPAAAYAGSEDGLVALYHLDGSLADARV